MGEVESSRNLTAENRSVPACVGGGEGKWSWVGRELGAPRAEKGRRARNKAKAGPASAVGDSRKRPEVSDSKGVWATCQDKVRAVGS